MIHVALLKFVYFLGTVLLLNATRTSNVACHGSHGFSRTYPNDRPNVVAFFDKYMYVKPEVQRTYFKPRSYGSIKKIILVNLFQIYLRYELKRLRNWSRIAEWVNVSYPIIVISLNIQLLRMHNLYHHATTIMYLA